MPELLLDVHEELFWEQVQGVGPELAELDLSPEAVQARFDELVEDMAAEHLELVDEDDPGRFEKVDDIGRVKTNPLTDYNQAHH